MLDKLWSEEESHAGNGLLRNNIRRLLSIFPGTHNVLATGTEISRQNFFEGETKILL